MIYFAESNELIKIGYSKNIRQRMKDLAWPKREIVLLKVIEGDKNTEKILHARFSYLSAGGEWFKKDNALLGFIKTSSGINAAEAMPKKDKETIQIGLDIKRMRLNKALTRENLCELADVSESGLRHLEDGVGCSLITFVKIVVALGKKDWLSALAPTVSINPLNMTKKGERKRGKRKTMGFDK